MELDGKKETSFTVHEIVAGLLAQTRLARVL